jgi:hypothetical protein
VILVFPVALGICAIALWRARGRTEGRGWRWFGAWAVTGAGLTLSFLSGFSIGLLLLPFALVLLALVARLSPQLPEAAGFVSGVGVMLIVVAFLNQDYRPCGSGVVTLEPGQTSVSCGGLDPRPWLVSGLAVFTAGCVAYALTSRARRRARPR